MQDARNLDRQLVPRLGDSHVAHLAFAGGRVRPAGLWYRAYLTYFPCIGRVCQLALLFLTLITPFLVFVQQSRTTPVVPTPLYCAGAHRGRRHGGCATFIR